MKTTCLSCERKLHRQDHYEAYFMPSNTNRKYSVQQIAEFVKKGHVVEVSITKHSHHDEITYWTLQEKDLGKDLKKIGSIIEKIKAGDKLYNLHVQVCTRSPKR